MADFVIENLGDRHEAAIELLCTVFQDSARYQRRRLEHEIREVDPPIYRHFVVALQYGELIGIGGIKAADWASNTHVLYHSAVAVEARGQGIGSALVDARLAWLRQNFTSGRVLVSTRKVQRFRKLRFKSVGHEMDGRRLMCLEF